MINNILLEKSIDTDVISILREVAESDSIVKTWENVGIWLKNKKIGSYLDFSLILWYN